MAIYRDILINFFHGQSFRRNFGRMWSPFNFRWKWINMKKEREKEREREREREKESEQKKSFEEHCPLLLTKGNKLLESRRIKEKEISYWNLYTHTHTHIYIHIFSLIRIIEVRLKW